MTLKLIEKDGIYTCDDRSEYGGVDIRQRAMFSHVWPSHMELGQFSFDYFCEIVFAHGWSIETTMIPEYIGDGKDVDCSEEKNEIIA